MKNIKVIAIYLAVSIANYIVFAQACRAECKDPEIAIAEFGKPFLRPLTRRPGLGFYPTDFYKLCHRYVTTIDPAKRTRAKEGTFYWKLGTRHELDGVLENLGIVKELTLTGEVDSEFFIEAAALVCLSTSDSKSYCRIIEKLLGKAGNRKIDSKQLKVVDGGAVFHLSSNGSTGSLRIQRSE